MKRFFAERNDGTKVYFSKEESNHIVKVSRLRKGDLISVPDLDHDLICEISYDDPERAEAIIRDRSVNLANPKADITLFMAVSKSDKMELIAQKACELGINRFIPFISRRCVKIPDEKSSVKMHDRIVRITEESLKQCGRNRRMEIGNVMTFDSLIASVENEHDIIFAYEKAEVPLKTFFDPARPISELSLIVGCEGGFDQDEAERLKKAGAFPVSLGGRILRAETAAIALMSVSSYLLDN